MSTPSALHAVHTELGASFTDFAGWSMPVRYSSELAEHRAVRQAAGLFDLSHMGEIEVTGPQAASALDYALLGTLSSVKIGRARYSMLCAEDGGVLDDMVTYRLAEDRYLVVANAANTARVAAELTTRAREFAAEVADRSAQYALIAVQGPAAADIVAAIADRIDSEGGLSALRYFASAPAMLGDIEVLLARTGYTGEDGFEVYCAPEHAELLWHRLMEAGEHEGLLPAGLACRDTLRLEAGMPLYGNELTERTTPFDAGFGRMVKFDKPGGFVGKAALEKHRHAEPSRLLVGFRGSGRRAARHGYRVLAADDDVGEITSGALSPTLGYPIAIGYVSSQVREPGTSLSVDIRGRIEPVEVVTMPFYSRAQ